MEHPESPVSTAVLVWWAAMSIIAVFNIAWWIRTARGLSREAPGLSAAELSARRWQLILCAGYVFGCAFRAMLPRADVQRICFVDSFWASIFVGRSVATVAELCFATQLALTVRGVAQSLGANTIARLAPLGVVLITIAETCSWYAVLTTNYRGNFIEESLWTVSALLATIACVAMWSRAGALQGFLRIGIGGGIAYMVFMVTVDLRMYFTRLSADDQASRTYLSLSEGLSDVIHRRVVTFAWSDWHDELAWMFLYFSCAVWLSIVLVGAPRRWMRARP